MEVYRYLVTSENLNAHGTLHGGILTKWVDEACGMTARLNTGGVCATRRIESVDFVRTAKLGDVVSIEVKRVSTGQTSIIFSANVVNAATGQKIASFDKLVFVALNEDHTKRIIGSS